MLFLRATKINMYVRTKEENARMDIRIKLFKAAGIT